MRPDLVRATNPASDKHVEMFHDRRQRHVKRRGEFADRQIGLFGEPHDQGAARRVGERGKGAVEGAALKLNHMV